MHDRPAAGCIAGRQSCGAADADRAPHLDRPAGDVDPLLDRADDRQREPGDVGVARPRHEHTELVATGRAANTLIVVTHDRALAAQGDRTLTIKDGIVASV